MMVHATADRLITLMAEFINTSATISASVELAPVIIGVYRNVKNLAFSGSATGSASVGSRGVIRATDCDNFSVSPTIFPDVAAAQTANMPFIFQGCNVPNGIFYHHAQIANTYKNIDFAKASIDLGKAIASGEVLVSSEVEGMYRLYFTTGSLFGGLVEGYDSVKSLNMAGTASSYGTTIYKDAYLNGLFDIAGTNVFGNKVRSHSLAQVLNVQPRVVQGIFNTVVVGETITGVDGSVGSIVCTPLTFRLNSPLAISIKNVPTGVDSQVIAVDLTGKILAISSWLSGDRNVSAYATHPFAYVMFRKGTEGAAITPADLAGVTVTVYNGCKIVNTGETAVNMKGAIRVEDNATLTNVSVIGTGYFGGNSVVSYTPAVWASLDINGTVHMKDNAVFAPTALRGSCTLVHMEGNAKFVGSVTAINNNLSFIMANNAIIEGISNTRSGVVMYGNSKVTATGQITAACRGVLTMKDNASIEADTTVIGAITLAGSYKGNVIKTWIGKRTITDVNEPEYDNNVKSQYDL